VVLFGPGLNSVCTHACSVFRPPSLVVGRGWAENARQVRSSRLSLLGPARKLADPQASRHLLPAGELAAKVTKKLTVAEAGDRARQRVSFTAGAAAGRERTSAPDRVRRPRASRAHAPLFAVIGELMDARLRSSNASAGDRCARPPLSPCSSDDSVRESRC